MWIECTRGLTHKIGALMFDQCLISVTVEHVFHWEAEANGPLNLVQMEWPGVFLTSLLDLEPAGPEPNLRVPIGPKWVPSRVFSTGPVTASPVVYHQPVREDKCWKNLFGLRLFQPLDQSVKHNFPAAFLSVEFKSLWVMSP